MCWYWPLAMIRSTHPTAQLRTRRITSVGASSLVAGGGWLSSPMRFSRASRGVSPQAVTTTRRPSGRVAMVDPPAAQATTPARVGRTR